MITDSAGKVHSRILVSACLLGVGCRFDGRSYTDERVAALAQDHLLVPVCPEQLGGLTTPRPAAEIVRGRVLTRCGDDITPAFLYGAQQGLLIAQRTGCSLAILQPRSPSCGAYLIYDGSFLRRLIPGQGILAALLTASGLSVCEPEDVPAMLLVDVNSLALQGRERDFPGNAIPASSGAVRFLCPK